MYLQPYYWVKRYNTTTQKWMNVYAGTNQKEASNKYADYTKFAKPQEQPMIRFYQNRELIAEF